MNKSLAAALVLLPLAACAAEPLQTQAAPHPTQPPMAGMDHAQMDHAQHHAQMHAQHHPQQHTQRQGGGAALAESLRAALARAQEALKEGRIDAAAYERILVNHQRAVVTLGAIQALGWGNYPPPPAAGNQASPRPPTRVEAIERLTERMSWPEAGTKPRPGPRK